MIFAFPITLTLASCKRETALDATGVSDARVSSQMTQANRVIAVMLNEYGRLARAGQQPDEVRKKQLLGEEIRRRLAQQRKDRHSDDGFEELERTALKLGLRWLGQGQRRASVKLAT